MEQPTITFAVRERVDPGIDVRVNFGVFAGRAATNAEIDRLSQWLLDEVGELSIISEQRHEIDAQVEASLHQVRIEVAAENLPSDAAERERIESRIVERADYWARTCIAERHADVSEL
jgi:hypothetical protein